MLVPAYGDTAQCMQAYLNACVRQIQQAEIDSGGEVCGYDRVQPHAHTQDEGVQVGSPCKGPAEGQAVQLGAEGGI